MKTSIITKLIRPHILSNRKSEKRMKERDEMITLRGSTSDNILFDFKGYIMSLYII